MKRTTCQIWWRQYYGIGLYWWPSVTSSLVYIADAAKPVGHRDPKRAEKATRAFPKGKRFCNHQMQAKDFHPTIKKNPIYLKLCQFVHFILSCWKWIHAQAARTQFLPGNCFWHAAGQINYMLSLLPLYFSFMAADNLESCSNSQ